ncbi:SDR family oxidoreductase [Chroococcidiopsis sp. FACHB-1243]|uniref:SDR family oxidoreductase n=1 Tax=Chroococcidiopsis sp. [FACHB-1243] TaxID=2692781 RepID=UPI00177B3FE2|nr:SDR family oxidoreductase [Chroococcidiopsis sp. [FACHB-1243]]MBD2304841.1 SDR family oxidoreductase [Chroococcidiopsis sp. [FACHB-1243]]
MSNNILVTGATGNVGSEVVRLLSKRGYSVKAAVRSHSASRIHLPSGVESVAFDFEQPQNFEPAFRGINTLFLVRPPAISQVKKYIYPALTIAQATGVDRIVFLSLLGAERMAIVPHAKIEAYTKSLGLTYTFLRASFFMQNLSTTHSQDIRDNNEIFVPAGKGKTSFIDVRDIAAIAVKVLTEPGHEDRAYALTGCEALDYYEVAQIFTNILGRQIVYTHPSILNFALKMYVRGLQPGLIVVMLGIYTTARLGLAAKVTEDVRHLLQRSPISMEEFVRDYRASWM